MEAKQFVVHEALDKTVFVGIQIDAAGKHGRRSEEGTEMITFLAPVRHLLASNLKLLSRTHFSVVAKRPCQF